MRATATLERTGTGLGARRGEEALGVLLPLDGAPSPEALRWAGDWAAATHQRLSLVGEVPRRAEASGVGGAVRDLARRTPGLAVSHAMTSAASAVVVGRLTRRASALVLAGPRHGPARPVAWDDGPHCPVLLVPNRLAGSRPDARVLLGLDAGEGAAITAAWAFAHASRMGVGLDVVRLCVPGQVVAAASDGPDRLARILDQFAVCYPGVDLGLPEPGCTTRERFVDLAADAALAVVPAADPLRGDARPERGWDAILLGIRRPFALVPAA